MAGTNLVLKPGQLLFKKGDMPTGLFIVRKGELQVFIEEEKGEFSLAKISGGSVIGEMAMFDNSPRSASVKAVVETELTFISTLDFAKMSAQVPNWFSSVIKTLSMRLRNSNERLQRFDLEFRLGAQRMVTIQRILTILDMLWYREGEKVEKEWWLDILMVRECLTSDFGEDPTMVYRVVQALVSQGLYKQKQSLQNRDVFTAPNRGALGRLLKWLRKFNTHRPTGPLEQPALSVLRAMRMFADQSAYDVLHPSLGQLKGLAKIEGLADTEVWEKHLPSLKKVGQELSITRGDRGDWLLKMQKKDIKDLVSCHLLLKAICAGD